MTNERVHILVSGRVQGVFFRANTQETALRLGITGWVMNTADGNVEIVAEGESDRIEKFTTWCHKGPSGSNVTDVRVETEEYEGNLNTFDIRY